MGKEWRIFGVRPWIVAAILVVILGLVGWLKPNGFGWILGDPLAEQPDANADPDRAVSGSPAAKSAADKSAADKDKQRDKSGKDKLAREKEKANFDAMRLNIVPHDPRDPLRAVKPGHWTSAALQTRANNFDFKGQLIARNTDEGGQPLSVEGTPFSLTLDRTVVLPKGQQKQFDLTLFMPRTLARPWLLEQLRDDVSYIEVKREHDQVQAMPPYQYYLVVLAREPARYRFLRLAEVVRPVADDAGVAEDADFYRVVCPTIKNRAPMPSHSLQWTSIAYVLWDDIDPQLFDPDQQHALLDWLHWGGHLIISGPKSLAALRGSFLEPYLPVSDERPRELHAQDLAELADYWTSDADKGGTKSLKVQNPWPGIAWNLQPPGVSLPMTGDLVAERQIGRGRVLVTAFTINQSDLLRWRGMDGFFNACLLRRAGRSFKPGDTGLRNTEWLSGDKNCWSPRQTSHLRYFARDSGNTGVQTNPRAIVSEEPQMYIGANGLAAAVGYDGGVAAWNDFGPLPEAVRRSLREGAGISVPRPGFVLGLLAAYLVVLVPVNWSVFKLLGRVEWAWGMTPVISCAFAALVIWMAQLDIGFARSSTELSIVEVEGDYPRAHLARYTALYASLSTGYDLHYESPSSVALPFPSMADFMMLGGQSRREVVFRRDEGVTLSGLEVSSNSTSLVHGEAVWDLGGGFSWNTGTGIPGELLNNTSLKLDGVGLIRRVTHEGRPDHIETAWIGKLSAGGSARPAFTDDGEIGASDEWPGGWQGSRPEPSPLEPTALDLSKLVALADGPQDIERGETRLVGWCLEEVPGLEITPVGAHRRHATLVVAHLHRAAGLAPQRDEWHMEDKPIEMVNPPDEELMPPDANAAPP